jgi:hypothetical protein
MIPINHQGEGGWTTQMANFPNRCQHLKINGTQCGSPALRRNRFCFFHKRFQDERIKLSADRARRGAATFELPILEDANSIQIALMQVMRLLVAGQLDHKTASLLLYALQTASANLRLTNFKPFSNDVILDPRDAANTPLDSHLWDRQDFEDEEEEDDEVETAADKAIAALEATRKKKAEDAKWMKWAEAQYPNPNLSPNPSAAVTATGSAVISPGVTPADAPASPPKKKPSKEEIRQNIREQVRKEFFPGSPPPERAES